MFDKLVKFFKNEQVTETLQIKDFPRGAYSAYWEIIDTDVPGGFRSEVRVLGYEGTIQREIEAFTSPTKAGVDKKVQDFLKQTMQRYKRT